MASEGQAAVAVAMEKSIETWPIEKLIPYDRNPRKITPAAVEKVARSIREFGFNSPILVDEEGVILAGHNRREALISLGATEAAVIVKRDLTDAQKRAYRIADNRTAEEAEWDQDLLAIEIADLKDDYDIAGLGFDDDELNKIMAGIGDGLPAASGGSTGAGEGRGNLSARFGVPPFSVLNARSGIWQDRKRAWLGLGIQSELGRGGAPGSTPLPLSSDGTAATDQLIARRNAEKSARAFGNAADVMSDQDGADRSIAGTSIFDPVLCELAYRWFCPPGGVVLDPFAGGSVRGVVASLLGREYHGIELRGEQVEANREQISLAGSPEPIWYQGDSREIDKILPRTTLADLIFTCPPYADLEVYSDHPSDLSNMSWPDFLKAYKLVIDVAAARLKPCRFAVFVVGDARGADGNYYGLPWKTIEFCEAAGLRLYNEAVLVTAVGTLPIRAPGAFEAARKLGKTHQNVLVFIKGDAKAATRDLGPCEFGNDKPAEQ